MKLSHKSTNHLIRSLAVMVLMILSVAVMAGEACAVDNTYNFAGLSLSASGGFKPQGNRFLVSELFENDLASGGWPSAICYNTTSLYPYPPAPKTVNGIIIKADGTNLISFDLKNMGFGIYPTGSDETITSLTITGTKVGGATVTTTVAPGFRAAGATFSLTDLAGLDLSGFTNITQLQFDITTSSDVWDIDFMTITLANEVVASSTPATQATAVQTVVAGATELNLAWTAGNGSSRVVFAKQGATSGVPAVSDGTTYAANADFSAATDSGGGWKSVYNGNGNSVSLSGLSASTQYRFVVFEYNGSSGNEKYLTTGAGNALNQATIAPFGTWSGGRARTADLAADVQYAMADTELDSSGNTYVVHRSDSSWTTEIQKWNGSSWATLTSTTPAAGGYASFSLTGSYYSFTNYRLAVTGVDNLRVATVAEKGTALDSQRGIIQATYNGSAWSFQDVAVYSDPNNYIRCDRPVIAVDGAGNSHILYEHLAYSDISTHTQYLKLASWNGAGWSYTVLNTIANSGNGNEVSTDYLLLNDAANKQHVFYFVFTTATSKDLHYWTNASGSGTDTTLFSGSTESPGGLQGAIDGSGKLHVTYYINTLNNADGYGVKYLTNTSGSWVTSTLLAPGFGYYPLELRINGNGDMVIPVRNASSKILRALLKQGSTWSLSTVSPAFSAEGYPGVTLRDDGMALFVDANRTGDTPRILGYSLARLWAAAPSATTGSASSVTGTGATLNGTVNDNGATTTVTFDYGTTAGYGTNSAATTGGTVSAGAGITAAALSITGLTCNTTYHFRVKGVNSAGTTNGSDATFTTSKCPQTITFNNPGSQNFGTTPTLSASASSGLTPTFTSSTTGVCTITGGGALTFVTAGTCGINADQAGNSTYLAAPQVTQSFTVNAVVPGAPIIGTATPGDTQASVAFTAPASNGGATITGYTITSSPGGATGTGGASPITVTGLTNGQAYTFTVTATNSTGTGNASAVSNSVTPRASQTITFNNPGSQNFGTTPTLTATANSGLTPTFTSSTTGVCTITSGGALTFVSVGTCTINANQSGNGSFNAATQVTQSFTVNAAVPGAPTIGTATPGDTQASVAFTAPAITGGAAITGYTITANPGGATGTGGASPITVTGLTNGTSYTFTVTATNSAGTGSASSASNSVTPKASQTITFTNPGAQNFGTTPTLTATASSGLTPTFTSSTTGVCTITSGGALTFVTTGTCTISADQAGNGAYLAASQVSRSFSVVAVVPGAPAIGTASAGDTQAIVTFTAPAFTGGAAITGYTVTSNPGGITGTGASSPITVTGLTNGQAYTFTVTATNSAGTGSASAASNSVTPNPGPAVVSVAVPANGSYKAGSNLDFTITWDSNATVTGTPRIALVIGSTTVYATYQSSPTATTTLFRYTVLPGQTDTDGITIGALSLNGGTIKNSSGTDATLTLNSVGSTTSVLVDTTAPTLSSIATSNPTHSGGTLTATANENALGSWIAVSSGATAPTVAQVLACADYGGVTVVAHGSGALSAGSPGNFSLSGLSAGTNYDIYLAAQDTAGNTSAAVSSATLITTTTRVITSANDSGAGSLRDTITNANPGDTITFDAGLSGQTITVATPLSIARDLTISGPGAGNLTVSSNGAVQVFQVNAGTTFTLEKVTVANGSATNGGALSDNATSTTTITGCAFTGNSATGNGGAIVAAGTMTISDTLFSNNSASQGGAIFNNNATLSLTNVTLTGNNATTKGGGLYNAGTASILNATIAGNSATTQGGGIDVASGTLALKNSIVANNSAPSGPDIQGTAVSQGYNLVRDTTGATFATGIGDLTGSDPFLGALADNGGLTFTMALLSGSQAIDKGNCTTGPAADQRGMTRPQSTLCDIGAYERGLPAAVTATAGTPQSAVISTAFSTQLKAKVADSFGALLDGISVAFAGPGSGAGITSGSSVTTDASGIASFSATANGTAGTYTVNATVNVLTSGFSLTNIMANQAITFNPPATATYGDTPITLSATGGLSGNPVDFAVTSGPGSLTGNVLTITGAGPIVVTASQAGNANYNAATSIQKTIAVGKATATIALTPASLVATYDGTAKAAAATTTPSGLSVNFTYDGSSTVPIAAGSYSVVASISDANYQGGATGTLNISKGGQTIIFGTAPTVVVGGTGMVSATGGASTNSVIFSSMTPSVCTVSSTTVTGVITGTCIIAADQAGNANYAAAATVSQNLIVAYNSAAPTLTISTLADGSITNNATLNVSGQATSINGITSVTVNGAAVTLAADGTFSQAVTLQAGTNTVTTIATDNAGTTTTDSRAITLDTTAPVITITAPADNGTLAASSVTVTGTVDKSATVQATVNGGSAQSAAMDGTSFTVTLNLSEGTNTITISATDLAGNSVSVKRTITSDTTKPTLAITDPAQDITTSQASLTITGTVSDALTEVSVTITCDGKSYTPQVANGAFRQQITFTTAKQYAITVTATDQAGNSVTTQRNVIYALSSLPSGDINNDGKVDIADALLALRVAVGIVTPTSAQLATGDVAPLSNGKPAPDGVIDIADAMLILEKAVGLLTW